MEQKSRNYTRIYIWHRFEQAEADCLLDIKQLSLKYKQISLRLMRSLITVGKLTGELSREDIKSMAEIIRNVSRKLKEKAPAS